MSFTVSAANGVIGDLVAMSSSITIDCSGSGLLEPCVWTCQSSQEYQLPYGTHTIELVSTGYQTKTIEFELEAPPAESCRCCGCPCQFGFTGQVTLDTDDAGEPAAGCCARTESDPNNCGECGRRCMSRVCRDGACVEG